MYLFCFDSYFSLEFFFSFFVEIVFPRNSLLAWWHVYMCVGSDAVVLLLFSVYPPTSCRAARLVFHSLVVVILLLSWCWLLATGHHHIFSPFFYFPFFFYTFTREIDTFIKGAAARTCVMMVVVVSLHEYLVYYRNSVDRDAEKEKKQTNKKYKAPPYQPGRRWVVD